MKAILLKELLDAIYGYKFLLALVLALVFLPFAIYFGHLSYADELAKHDETTLRSQSEFRNQTPKDPHIAAHFGLVINKPPPVHLGLVRGLHNVLGVMATIDPHTTPKLMGSPYSSSPILAMFGNLDLAIVVQIVFGLLALIFAHNLISGEKEAGTLALICSHAVSRRAVLLAKTVGGLITLNLPLIAGMLLGIVLVIATGVVTPDGEYWIRAMAIFGISALYVSMLFLLGISVSVHTTRTGTSFIILLFVWTLLTFIAPRMALLIAEHVHDVPSVQAVERKIQEIEREADKRQGERMRAFRQANPEFESGPLPVTERLEMRRARDAFVEDREAAESRRAEDARQRQVRLAANLARLAPSSAYRFAVMELAGTGVARHRRFEEQLDRYRIAFRDYFDRQELAGITELERFDQVPEFRFEEEKLGTVLGRVIPDISILAALCLLLIGESVISFTRYDVR